MVVSVKEATQSRLQLVEDRKTLMRQLNDLKKKSRLTFVASERAEIERSTKGGSERLVFHLRSGPQGKEANCFT
jgi:hypothetical protein